MFTRWHRKYADTVYTVTADTGSVQCSLARWRGVHWIVEPGDLHLKRKAHNLMTEDESVDSVRVETRLELLYLMTEDEL